VTTAWDDRAPGPVSQGELDRAAARARSALEWRQSVEALRVPGTHDGVRVVLSGTGILVDLTIPTSACADGGEALTNRIVEALARARADAARQVARSAADAYGEDSAQARSVTASWDAAAARRTAVIGGDTTADQRDEPPPDLSPSGRW
jgi:DNA-binding protein YbaB